MTTSWKGYEEQLARLRQLADDCIVADQLLESMGFGNATIGGTLDLTVRALKQPQRENIPEARAAAKAHKGLTDYHSYLVNLGLHFDLVRKEWAVILNPHPAEIELCNRNLALAIAGK